LGTATQGFFQYFMLQKYPGTYPTTLQAAAISAAALTSGYLGMTSGKIPRPVAVYILGFGISQVVSYLLPRLTGTPALDARPVAG
jgi:hypothetical protein